MRQDAAHDARLHEPHLPTVQILPPTRAPRRRRGTPADEVLLALTGDSGKELVYSAQANEGIKAGTVGLSGPQRTALGLELSAPMRATPYKPTIDQQLSAIQIILCTIQERPINDRRPTTRRPPGQVSSSKCFSIGQGAFGLDPKQLLFLTVDGMEFTQSTEAISQFPVD